MGLVACIVYDCLLQKIHDRNTFLRRVSCRIPRDFASSLSCCSPASKVRRYSPGQGRDGPDPSLRAYRSINTFLSLKIHHEASRGVHCPSYVRNDSVHQWLLIPPGNGCSMFKINTATNANKRSGVITLVKYFLSFLDAARLSITKILTRFFLSTQLCALRGYAVT